MDFPLVAPRDSESHRRLIDAAAAANQDTELLRDILWLIAAHGHLIALPRAVRRIQRILDLTPKSWAGTLEATGISAWRPILDWIAASRYRLGHVIGKHFSRESNTNNNNPILGSGAQTFPLYTVLCEPISNDRLAPYAKLTGHLLIAQVLALHEESSRIDYEVSGNDKPWQPLPNSIYPATFAVRRLAERELRAHLDKLPVDEIPEQFAELLSDLPLPDDPRLAKNQEDLSRFLQKAWGQLAWHESGGGGGGGSGGHKWAGGQLEIGENLLIEPQLLGDSDDVFSAWGGIDIAKALTTSPKKRNSRLESDLPPDEDDDDDCIVLSDYDCASTKRDIGALARAARAKSRYVAASNQQVPWAYDGLAVEEVASLLAAIRRDFERLNSLDEWTKQDVLSAKTLVLLHVMLWTGSDAQRAGDVRLCRENRQPMDSDLSIVMPTNGRIDKIRWRVRAGAPSYRTNLDGAADQLRAKNEFLELPDLIGLSGMVSRLAAKRGSIPQGSRLFDSPSEVLERSLRAWLKGYSPDGRITPTKIAGFLWKRLFESSGDAATVAAITGNMHRLARVRIFYTSPSASVLQERYAAVIGEVTRLLYTALGKTPRPVEPWLPPESTSGAVGARLCPTVAAVRSLFARLREDVAASANYTDRVGFIRHHNLFTLYTLQFFAYCTTCRAIVTPYVPITQVDPTRGLVSLSDKDDDTRHRTRLVWLPETMREQMARHERHQRMLTPQLIRPTASMLNEPCFFLDDGFSPDAARPGTIEPLLRAYLDVRANTHRRFLRTELIERHCPPEVVDAFLGHWQQGEEPFGPYSSFSFGEHVDILRSHLTPLLTEIGLDRPVSSHLAP